MTQVTLFSLIFGNTLQGLLNFHILWSSSKKIVASVTLLISSGVSLLDAIREKVGKGAGCKVMAKGGCRYELVVNTQGYSLHRRPRISN